MGILSFCIISLLITLGGFLFITWKIEQDYKEREKYWENLLRRARGGNSCNQPNHIKEGQINNKLKIESICEHKETEL